MFRIMNQIVVLSFISQPLCFAQTSPGSTQGTQSSQLQNFISLYQSARTSADPGTNTTTSSGGIGTGTSSGGGTSSTDVSQLTLSPELMQQLTESANGIVGQLNQTANDLGRPALAQYSRTLDIAEKIIDPRYMFILSAATGAGAVIGSGVARAALAGIELAVKELYAWASGKKKKEMLAQGTKRFNEARKLFEENEKSKKTIENSLAGALGFLEVQKQLGIDQSIVLDKIGPFIEDYKVRYEVVRDELKNQTVAGDFVSSEKTAKESHELKKFIQELEMIQSLNERSTQKSFCENVKDSTSKLKETRGLLQKLRLSMLALEHVWKQAAYEEFRKTGVKEAKLITSERFRRKNLRLDRKEFERLDSLAEKNILKQRDSLFDDCSKLVRKNKLVVKQEVEEPLLVCSNQAGYSEERMEKFFDQFEEVSDEVKSEFERLGFVDRFKQIQQLGKSDPAALARLEAIYKERSESEKFDAMILADVATQADQMSGMIEFIQKLKKEQSFLSSHRLDKTLEKIDLICN